MARGEIFEERKKKKKRSKLGRLLEGGSARGGLLFLHTFFLTSPVFMEDDALKGVVNFFLLFQCLSLVGKHNKYI